MLRRTTLLVNNNNFLLWLKATFGLYVVTLVLGFAGNVTVLVIFGFKKTRKRRPHELFIINLAVGDLMLIIFFLPFQILIFVGKFYPSTFYCKVIAPLITVALGVSVFTLTVMAAHRCYIITNPFKPTVSQRSVYTWLVTVWILSIGLAVPKTLVSANHSNRCIQQWPSPSLKKLYTLSLFVVRFVIPLFIITYAYARIAKDLAGSTAPRFQLDENGKIKTQTARHENIMMVKTLTVIVLLFVMCMLPYRLATMVMMFGEEHHNRLARYIRQYTSVLTIFHSCVNPIAYGALGKHFCSCLARFNSWIQGGSAQHANNREVSSKPHQNRTLNQLLSRKSRKTPVMITSVKFHLEAERFYENRKETTV